MSEPTIHEQAVRYIDVNLSYSELHRWVYDRIGPHVAEEFEGGAAGELAAQLVGLMAEYDLDAEIFGNPAKAESVFRQAVTEYMYARQLS